MTRNNKGLLIIHTGNGKGKTTAALGLALRMVGYQKKISVIQFIKGTKKTGEFQFASRFSDLFDFHVMGRGCTFKSDDRKKDVEAAEQAWAFAEKTLATGACDLLILDELTYLIRYEMVDEETILKALAQRPRHLHVVVTGRHASERLIDAADLVTEMREVKHPFKKGIKARRGIEF